jgi:hypothetical protein
MQRFKTLLTDMYTMHGKELTAGMVKVWIAQLGMYTIEAVEGAFNAYWRSATKPPLPADILKFLPDPFGHLGPEEAWGFLPKTDRDAGYVTDQMMAARAAAEDSIERRDFVAGRVAFLEAYRREVAMAQSSGIKAKYWYCNADGLSHEQRLILKERLTVEAAEKKWINPQRALKLLEDICAEQRKSLAPHLNRLQALSKEPLRTENTLPNVKPDTKRITEALRLITQGTKIGDSENEDTRSIPGATGPAD